jgi:hypothetical protein
MPAQKYSQSMWSCASLEVFIAVWLRTRFVWDVMLSSLLGEHDAFVFEGLEAWEEHYSWSPFVVLDWITYTVQYSNKCHICGWKQIFFEVTFQFSSAGGMTVEKYINIWPHIVFGLWCPREAEIVTKNIICDQEIMFCLFKEVFLKSSSLGTIAVSW